MSDNVVRIGRGVKSFQTAPEFDGYTKVVIALDENYEYTAGTDEGRTLHLENPWATQSMAENILDGIRGFQYQPYSAHGAVLDPAAEIGDGVVINNIYGGIYRKKTIFGRRFTSDISAPGEEEINHEFPYIEKKDRKIARQLANLESELNIQGDRISAKVSMTGGEASSFGWVLDEKSWTIQANSVNVVEVDRTGLTVRGHVFADEGEIGGFLLENNALSTNGQTFGGTNAIGVYVGPSGIQLGSGFKVDAYGNLEASRGKFTGEVSAGSIVSGESDGYFDGSGIATESIYGSSIARGTISAQRTKQAVQDSLGYANDFNLINLGAKQMSYLDLNDHFYFQNHKIVRRNIAIPKANGSYETIYFLAWDG